ncbi:hypothetical protein V1498_20880 [Peribacillus sp. SCS-26]|uniref:hypothetical protein n=1 Tax=Paraperibacillus marinus TaxID=3115295 RepID=UPI003905F072
MCQQCKEWTVRQQRVEELLTDLIKIVGRTHVKALNGEEQIEAYSALLHKAETELLQFRRMSAGFEERLTALESRSEESRRTQLAEGRPLYTLCLKGRTRSTVL